MALERLRRRGALWSHPDFLRLWSGQAVSLVGDTVAGLAVPLTAVVVLDAGATEMGILAAAAWLPHLLFSLPAGVWVDRRAGRRSMMVAADVARAALVGSVPLAYWLDALTIEFLLGVVLAQGAFTVLFDVANGTYFLSVVPREHIVEAQSKLSVTRSTSFIAGPALGGWLVQVLTAPVALLVDAISYLVSALFIARIRAPEPPLEPIAEPIRRRLADGFRFVFGHPILRAGIGCTSTVNFFNLAFGAIVILYLVDELGLSPAAIGLVFGIGAVGGIVGSLVAPWVARRIGIGPAVAVGAVLFPLPLLLIPLATGPTPVVYGMLFAAEFLCGVGVMIFDINQNSLTLLITPHRMRPRQIAIGRVFNYGVRPVGAVFGGLLGAAIGLKPALLVTGAATLLGVLFLLWGPTLSVHEPPPEPAD